jgi:hypothetical protein
MLNSTSVKILIQDSLYSRLFKKSDKFLSYENMHGKKSENMHKMENYSGAMWK